MSHLYLYMTDLQQLPPAGWCPKCGREIYAEGLPLCKKCAEKEKEVSEDDV